MKFGDQLIGWVEAQLRKSDEFKWMVEGPEFSTVAFTSSDFKANTPISPAVHQHVVGYLRQKGGGLDMRIIIAFESVESGDLSVAPVYMDFTDTEVVRRFSDLFPRWVSLDDIAAANPDTDS